MASTERTSSTGVRTDRVTRRVHTVLVADDDEQVRSLVWELLANEGYRVLPARNGQDALEVLARHGAGVDVLLADVVMPRLGGRELAMRVRTEFPHIRVLFVSGYGDNEDFRADFPEASVIEKPFAASQLTEAVQTAVRKRSA